MTRRLVAVIVLGVGAAFAAVLPAPSVVDQPVFAGNIALSPGVTASSSVWYCPWANSGAFRDSAYLLASAVPTQSRVTLPSALPTEPADQIEERIVAQPGALALELGEFGFRNGDAPGLVELNRGPAGAAVLVRGEALLTGDTCVRNLTRKWYLPGGTTRQGRTTTLRIYNPLANDAKVEVIGASEFGIEPIEGLSNVDVRARSWIDIDMTERVPFIDDLALTVTVLEGDVVPTLIVGSDKDGDEASWPGTAAASTWYFPTVTQGGLVPTLMVLNPSDGDIEVTVDVFGLGFTTNDAVRVMVPPFQPVRITLSDLADGVFGVRVRGTGPIAAVVVAEDGDPALEPDNLLRDFERIAGTVGTEVTARRWLLPGPNHLAEPRSSIWLLNPTADIVTVTLQPLAGRRLPARKLTLGPGNVLRIIIERGMPGVGYLVESTQPIAVSWSIHTPRSVAFIAGTPIDG